MGERVPRVPRVPPVPHRLTRRQLLGRGAALAGSAALGQALAGCGAAADVLGFRQPVTVAVSWSASELAAFNAVLSGLGRLPYDVEVLPLGDDIGAAFGPSTAQRPDIVMMPQPATVIENRGRLAPLPRELDWPYAPVWRFLRPDDAGPPIGVPFKMAHESTVWYRRSVFAAHRLAVPTRWSDWLAVNGTLAANGVPPLAVAAADGWMLTQNFDNVLLGSAGRAHQQLVAGQLAWTHPAVLRALRIFARMWAMPGALAGGIDGSLVQQFPDAVVEVFGHRRAAMVVAPDFAEGVIRQFADDLADVGAFPFPALDGDRYDGIAIRQNTPLVVGGDIAVVVAGNGAPAEDNARDLVTRLAAATAPLPWITGHGGFIAANRDTDRAAYSPQLAELVDQLTAPTRDLVVNLSDELGALGGRDGLWLVLQDLLKAVGGRGPDAVPEAALAAAARMDRLARDGR